MPCNTLLQVFIFCLAAIHFTQGDDCLGNKPIISVPLTRQYIDEVNEDGGLSIVKRGRFAATDTKLEKSNLKGTPGQGYYIPLLIGTPPQKLNVLVDTGSSNFALAAAPHPDIDNYFKRSSSRTYSSTGISVYVPYTQGKWTGILGRDKVAFQFFPNKTVYPEISFITSSSNFFIASANWEGILGMAYSEIARPRGRVVPFFDSLVKEWKIYDLFALQMCGATREKSHAIGMQGTLNIGGTDSSLYTGELHYTPIRKRWYYEVIIADIKISGKSLGMDCKEYNFDKTIVDSGTTDLRLPRRVYTQVVNRLKALVSGVAEDFWTGKSLLCFPEHTGPWKSFPILTISLMRDNYSIIDLHVSPQQYLRFIGEKFDVPNKDCFKIGIQASDLGAVLGAVVMEGYYTVFDRAKRRIGFANSPCNAFDRRFVVSSVSGPRSWSGSSTVIDCGYIHPPSSDTTLLLIAYIMGAFILLIMLPIPFLLCFVHCRRWRQHDAIANDILDSPPTATNDTQKTHLLTSRTQR